MRRTSTTLMAGVTALALSASAPSMCGAQGFPFSQRARVDQTLAFTDISITYGRPVARGRQLFGDSALVKWNAVWHPGADSATIIRFTHNVRLEGHDVRAGEYSVWLVPRATGPWTFILSRAAHTFHTPYPGDSLDLLRVDVTTEHGAHMETLAYYFPVVLRDEAVMRIHWGETIVPVRLKAPYRPQ